MGRKDAVDKYRQASERLEDYDKQAGRPGWDRSESDRLEQEKYDASRNVPWWRR
jgi:hypothetical protein